MWGENISKPAEEDSELQLCLLSEAKAYADELAMHWKFLQTSPQS